MIVGPMFITLSYGLLVNLGNGNKNYMGMSVEERVAQARAHYSHPSFLIGDWQPMGP